MNVAPGTGCCVGGGVGGVVGGAVGGGGAGVMGAVAGGAWVRAGVAALVGAAACTAAVALPAFFSSAEQAAVMSTPITTDTSREAWRGYGTSDLTEIGAVRWRPSCVSSLAAAFDTKWRAYSPKRAMAGY